MSQADRLLDDLFDHARALRDGNDTGALRVLVRQAERLAMGMGQYGRVDAVKDKRKWLAELRDELTDALLYIDNEEQREEAARRDRPTEPRLTVAPAAE